MLLTQSKAADIFNISRTALSKKSKQENPPSFFVRVGSKIMVDTEDQEWLELMEWRAQNLRAGDGHLLKSADNKKKVAANKKKATGKGIRKATIKPPKQTKEQKEARKHLKEANARQEYAQDLKNEKLSIDIGNARLDSRKKAETVIEIEAGKFLYFGYMEKVGLELLNLTKKIKPIIGNLVKERDLDGVLAKFHKEHQAILDNAYKAQTKELKEWQAGN